MTGSNQKLWQEKNRIDAIANNMTRKTSELITVMLHSEHPKYQVSRTAKFQMVNDQFNHTAAGIFMEDNLTIDEQIIDYKVENLKLGQNNKNHRKRGSQCLCSLLAWSYSLTQIYVETMDSELNGMVKTGQCVM